MEQSKGERTRAQIVDRAWTLAAEHGGFDDLSLADMAADIGISKGGLFAHFLSKEELELAVLARAAERFIDLVAAPAKAVPAGEARMRKLFEGGLKWLRDADGRRTCIFTILAQERFGRPGRVRDYLASAQRNWRHALADHARGAIEAGDFRKDLDVDQYSFEQFGIGLSYQTSVTLLGDRMASRYAQTAFESLLERSRAPRRKRKP